MSEDHSWEFFRDIPRSCICAWVWNGHLCAYLLLANRPGCPWHRELNDLIGAITCV